MKLSNLDCIIIGHNEPDFKEYEAVVAAYGKDSETYQDLQKSFVELDGIKMTYLDLLNHTLQQTAQGHSGPEGANSLKSGGIPSLSTMYLTHYLLKREFKVEYINLFQAEKERLVELLKQKPLCVAITTTLYLLNFPAIEIVEFIRKHNRETKIIIGGPLILNHSRQCKNKEELFTKLSDLKADIYVIESQGEATLAHVIENLGNETSLSGVPNVVYVEEGGFHQNELVKENNSLDENHINWAYFAGNQLGSTLQTRTARSCAFKCSFCGYPSRAGEHTLASLDSIEKEFDSIQALGAVENLLIIDDTFNVPIGRFKDICRLMIRKQYGFNWFSYLRCANTDEETIALMAESGCKGVFLGIESGSPRILKLMNKGAHIHKYAEGVRLLKQHNILTFGSFIIGFPGETEESVIETIDFINDNQPDFYRAQSWYCEPGTPIYELRDQFKISGAGFSWEHESMDSMEAMDHINQMLLTIKSSLWLPQWSFDFWIIPYLMGKGFTIGQFREFVEKANDLLALEVAFVPPQQKKTLQDQYFNQLVEKANNWNLQYMAN